MKETLARQRLTVGVALASILLLAHNSWGCSVPVFRYALERWQPDPFGVYVFCRGDLPAEQKQLVDRLSPQSGANANVFARTVNLDEDQPEPVKRLWKEHETDNLPWMVVQSPGNPSGVISARLTKESVDTLLDSPLRQEVANRILAGDSAVWVLLESGDPQADQLAADMLTKEINRLQSELELPEITEQDIQAENLDVDPDELSIRFSLVRLSRADQAEQEFVEMLLSTEPDLRDEQFTGQPIAFPVFGRGRVLYALIGKGINQDTITEACMFVTGACQCTVKAQNPGVDLLTMVDWDARVIPSQPEDQILPELVGLTEFGDVEGAEEDTSSAYDREEESVVADATPVSSLPEDTQVAMAPAAQSMESNDQEASHANANAGSLATPVNLGTLAICVVGVLVVVVAGLSLILTRR